MAKLDVDLPDAHASYTCELALVRPDRKRKARLAKLLGRAPPHKVSVLPEGCGLLDDIEFTRKDGRAPRKMATSIDLCESDLKR
jgi:hypothetical protein